MREARLPEERAALEAFVVALNRFEHVFEPNRRLDEAVGPDYLAVLIKHVKENEGRIFVAEQKGVLVGWLVSIIETRDVFVREDERKLGYVAELFVEAAARRGGVGRALIEKAEADFRARGLRKMGITVLPGNAGARAAYAAWGFEPSAISLCKDI